MVASILPADMWTRRSVNTSSRKKLCPPRVGMRMTAARAISPITAATEPRTKPRTSLSEFTVAERRKAKPVQVERADRLHDRLDLVRSQVFGEARRSAGDEAPRRGAPLGGQAQPAGELRDRCLRVGNQRLVSNDAPV